MIWETGFIAQKRAPPTHIPLMLAGVVVSQVIRPKSDGGSVEMADKMLADDPQPR